MSGLAAVCFFCYLFAFPDTVLFLIHTALNANNLFKIITIFVASNYTDAFLVLIKVHVDK